MTGHHPIVDPRPSSEPSRAEIDAQSKAKLTEILIDMLIEQRARVAYLCDLMSLEPEDFFALPVTTDAMVPYIEAAAVSEIPANLAGMFNRC